MNQRSKQHRRLSQLETLEKRNLLAFGLRSFLASSFHDASVPAAEVTRAAVKTAPIVASNTFAAPVSNFSAVQSLQSVEPAPQAASLRTSAKLESASDVDADSANTESIESSSGESLPTERFSLRTLLQASAQPNTSYQLTVAGVTLGTVTTDDVGDLLLELIPVAEQRDEDTGSDGRVEESLSTSLEHASTDESHAVVPFSEATHDSDLNEVNGSGDDLVGHLNDDHSVDDGGQVENSMESSGGEDVEDSHQETDGDLHNDTTYGDDATSLSHERVDEVHSEADDVVGRVDDASENGDLSFAQDSSIGVSDDSILESHNSNEGNEQHDEDSLSELDDGGSFDSDSHIDDDNDDLRDLGSSHDSNDADTGSDDGIGSDMNDNSLGQNDDSFKNDSHIDDERVDLHDLDSSHVSDDTDSDNDDGVNGDMNNNILGIDDDLFDHDSHVDDNHDDLHILGLSHDSDDADSDNDDGIQSDTDDNHASHDDDLFDDDSRIGDEFDDLQDQGSCHDSDDRDFRSDDISDTDTDDNNLSNDLDHNDGSSSDDIPVVAGSATQAHGEWKTYLSGNGTAEIEFEKERGETEFEVEVRGFAPNGSFPVTIGGVLVGQIRTDSRGRGELEYEIGDDHYRPFPADFPVIEAGVTIRIGTQLSGVFGSASSSHHDD